MKREGFFEITWILVEIRTQILEKAFDSSGSFSLVQDSLRSFFFSSYDQAFVIVPEFVTVGDEFALELRSDGSVMRIQQWIAENRDEFHGSASNC
jgi:hypothetical protein